LRLQSLGVRSSAVASRFAADVPDLNKIARDAQVDLALTGTFMHANLAASREPTS
jgi:hypothetical protein